MNKLKVKVILKLAEAQKKERRKEPPQKLMCNVCNQTYLNLMYLNPLPFLSIHSVWGLSRAGCYFAAVSSCLVLSTMACLGVRCMMWSCLFPFTILPFILSFSFTWHSLYFCFIFLASLFSRWFYTVHICTATFTFYAHFYKISCLCACQTPAIAFLKKSQIKTSE